MKLVIFRYNSKVIMMMMISWKKKIKIYNQIAPNFTVFKVHRINAIKKPKIYKTIFQLKMNNNNSIFNSKKDLQKLFSMKRAILQKNIKI